MTDDARRLLTAEWDMRGIDLATVQIDSSGTIVPSRRTIDGQDLLRSLPLISTHDAAGQAEIALFDVLGEGGMGIVWLGEQTALRREVAVKGLRPEVASPLTTHQLLREARVTGALEHPNVVPVHALGRDENGRPLIVMKRIEGTSWLDLLGVSQRARDGVPADLQRHLEILVDVSRAVHFAHTRAIVHRDLKPENVMIGAFGEVYVVDWGIAVRTDPARLPGIPLAREIDSVAGTPEYMAPEMATGDGGKIDERTDVYLLGAILHEIVTGHAPHEADAVLDSLALAYESAPASYPGVHDDLVSILHCAMNRDREERFQTAQAFANAVQGYLRHRNSIELCEEAERNLDVLRAAIPAIGDRDDLQALDLYTKFSECRFGFTHARRIWKHNQRARAGLQQALELMIEYELEQGAAGAAGALVNELPEPRPDLAERIAAGRRKELRAERELERIAREADPTHADRLRTLLALLVALSGGPLLFFFGWARRAEVLLVGHFELALLNGAYLLASLLAGVVAREKLFGNAAGLRQQLTILLSYGASAALWPIADRLGMSLADAFTMQMLMGTFLWLTAAAVVDRRMITVAISMMAGLVLVLLYPALCFEWMGAVLLGGSGALAWLRHRTRSADEARPLSQRWSRDRVDQLLREAPRSVLQGRGGVLSRRLDDRG